MGRTALHRSTPPSCFYLQPSATFCLALRWRVLRFPSLNCGEHSSEFNHIKAPAPAPTPWAKKCCTVYKSRRFHVGAASHNVTLVTTGHVSQAQALKHSSTRALGNMLGKQTVRHKNFHLALRCAPIHGRPRQPQPHVPGGCPFIIIIPSCLVIEC